MDESNSTPTGSTTSPLKQVAFVGSYLPRRCGIATFTNDLLEAVAGQTPDTDTWCIAMNDRPGIARRQLHTPELGQRLIVQRVGPVRTFHRPQPIRPTPLRPISHRGKRYG